jgi:hypothetical protein
MSEPAARAGMLRQLFRRERLDPAADKIVAVAIIHERDVAPAVLGDSGGAGPVDQARLLAAEIVPQYRPHLIPAGAHLSAGTRCVHRLFAQDESLDPGSVNQALATMLAQVLDDLDLVDASAISLSGSSPALGETRFAVVARTRSAVPPQAPAPPPPTEPAKHHGLLSRLRRGTKRD